MQDFDNSMSSRLRQLALECGPNLAVVHPWGRLNHEEFLDASLMQARALEALGVLRGERVVLISGNRVEVLILLAACAHLSCVLVPINTRLSQIEIEQQVTDASPKLIVIDEVLGTVVAQMPAATQCIIMKAPRDTELALIGPRISSGVLSHGPSEHDPVLMLYTAATQGRAKGAVLSQANLVASAQQLALAWQITESDRWLGVLPLCHAAGLSLALAVQLAGGASILFSRFDASEAVKGIDQHQVSLAITFSPMLSALMDAAISQHATLNSLRLISGLEPDEVWSRFAASCPHTEIWTGYGQAEVSAMVSLGKRCERLGAMGRAAPLSEIAILDPSGALLPPGKSGEIAVRGPTVFLGYWNPSIQEIVPTLDPIRGWHRTGDLGHIDGDGWLWFEGRADYKQLIKSGGENIYPLEVETVLLQHPQVLEAYVFGLPDAQWGESVHARCVLEEEATVSADDLMDFVSQRLARFKRPRHIEFVPIPLLRKID
jgi:acyl-CoA synthetase (AMP-forming)/AMP-acid ligase II